MKKRRTKKDLQAAEELEYIKGFMADYGLKPSHTIQTMMNCLAEDDYETPLCQSCYGKLVKCPTCKITFCPACESPDCKP